MLTDQSLTTLRSGCVPGDLWPDLLAEWYGPIRYKISGTETWSGGLSILARSGEPVRLDLLRPEVRAHVARVMAVGLDGVRPPAPAWHILPSGETATPLLPEWAPHAPALLACHVARVAAGADGIRGVLPVWRECDSAYFMSFKRCAAHWRRDTDTEVVCLDGVWFRRRGLVAEFRAGPETGPAGMAAADRAALAAGFALMNADGPVLPWPNPDAT